MLHVSLSRLLADLTATKSTSITAVAVLAGTFLPLAGGPIKPYEMREFRAGVVALMNGETSTPQLAPVYHPQWSEPAQLVKTPTAMNTARVTRAVYTPPLENVEEEADAPQHERIEPVSQLFETPLEVCADECGAEPLMLDEAELPEIPEVEAVDEFVEIEVEAD